MTRVIAASLLVLVSLDASAEELSSAQKALASAAYEVGTDIGGDYLHAYGPKLRTFVLLRECGEKDLYDRLGSIPASFDVFMKDRRSEVFSGDDKLIAAQVTNGFLLGFQFALRLEYQTSTKQQQMAFCREAKVLANGFLSGEI